MISALRWAAMRAILIVFHYLCRSRPDMTFAVDWALSNNYLSICAGQSHERDSVQESQFLKRKVSRSHGESILRPTVYQPSALPSGQKPTHITWVAPFTSRAPYHQAKPVSQEKTLQENNTAFRKLTLPRKLTLSLFILNKFFLSSPFLR